MRPYPLSVQLYSLREECKKDFIGVLKKAASWGYHGVEFAGLHGQKPADIRRIIDDLGLKASSVHGPVPTAENVSQIIDEAKTLGYTRCISGPKPEYIDSYENTLKTAESYENGARLLKKAGLMFGVHNHEWEFNRVFNGKTPHDIIKEKAPSVFFQLDTYWVKVGHAEPATIIRKCAGRVPLLHIKDGLLSSERTMTAVGAGKMDWAPVMDAADASGVEWLVVELDACKTDMAQAIKESREWLVSKGYVKA
ncbi:MAG: sugar phosphate isomerase/epimerase [Fibrobacterota bacterium]